MDRLKTFLHLLEEDAVFGADGDLLFASDVSRNFVLPIAMKLEGDMFIHKLRNLGFEQRLEGLCALRADVHAVYVVAQLK